MGTTTEKELLMGLDQYLHIKKYVRAVDYSHAGMEPSGGEIEKTLQINSILDLAGASSLKLDPEQRNWAGIYVEMVGLQWRKQYAVQDWFEKQFGEMENCKRYDVSREQLTELHEIVKKINDTIVFDLDTTDQWGQHPFVSIDASLASQLLPADGSLDYDEWYAYGVQQTKEGLDKILGAADLADAEFQYHGWW
jgi:hypothetical protein